MRELAKATLLTWIGTAAVMLAAVIRSKVLAVTIGPAGVGTVAQLFTFVTFIGGIGSLYLGSGVAQNIARLSGDGGDDDVRRIVQSGLAVVALVSLILALLVIAFAPNIAKHVIGVGATDVRLFRLAAASVLLFGLIRHLEAVYSGLGAASLTSAAHIATALATVILSVSFTRLWGLEGAIAALTLTYLVSLSVQLMLLHWRRPDVLGGMLRYLDRRAFRVILPMLLRIGAVSFIMGSADSGVQLLVRSRIIALYGVEANGLYQAAFGASNQLITSSMGFIASYAFARVNNATTSSERTSRTNQAFRLGLVIVTGGVSLLAFSRYFYIRLLLSPSFYAAAPFFVVQAIGEALKQLGLVVGMAVLLTAGLHRWLTLGLFWALSNLVLSFTILPLGQWTLPIPYCLSGLGYFLLSYRIISSSDGFLLTRRNALALLSALPLVGAFLLASYNILWLTVALALALAWGWLALGDYHSAIRSRLSFYLLDLRRQIGWI